MSDNEKPLSSEEIEQQKKIMEDLYKRENEEREKYLKSTEGDRKKAFETSKTQIQWKKQLKLLNLP